MLAATGPVAALQHLEPIDPDTGRINVVIDTPRGSRCKYKLDEKTGVFRLRKLLPRGAAFPYAFGCVPGTRGADGDPLDVLVLQDEAFFVGCVVPVRLIGVLEAEQTEPNGKTMRNDRLIGVVETEFNPPVAHALSEVSRQDLDEIERFFVSYNEAEGKRFRPLGRYGPDRAEQLLEEGRRLAQPEQVPAGENVSPPRKG